MTPIPLFPTAEAIPAQHYGGAKARVARTALSAANAAEARAVLAEALAAGAGAEVEELWRSAEVAADSAIDERTLEKLQSLGYVGAQPTAPRPYYDLPDPKDRLEEMNLLIRARRESAEMLEERRCAFEARVSLVGDSAGGALCATAAHLLRYEPAIEIESQVLIYPSLDYTLSMPSVQAFCDGYLLERDRIIWYFDQYFQNAEDRSEKSPLSRGMSMSARKWST